MYGVHRNRVMDNSDYKVWELKGDFATKGIKKMARRTFQEIASNIEELIANAYDEDATLVNVIVDHNRKTLTVIDDGNGMDEKALSSYVIYGESEKTQAYLSPKFQRSPIGEYGMGGKLAITNLCKKCTITTRKNGKEHIFNMNKAQLDKAKYVSDIRSEVRTGKCDPSYHGTSIYMEDLTYKNIDSDRLIDRFSYKMPSSQNFKILLSIVRDSNKTDIEIKEPSYEYMQKFDFENDLKLIGKVKLVVYYTSDPVPANKQGIWTKVNGRIVNEKQEWFGLLMMTSGHRYKWRLYGIGEADGLKDHVTFSKNDFVDGAEYQEYYNFVHKSLLKVQNTLLKQDEDAKKERDRSLVKDVEKEINGIVSQLDDPQVLGTLEAKIKKEFTRRIEEAPEVPIPELEKVQEKINELASTAKRGKDRRKRRHQSLSKDEQMSYSGKNYIIETVDMSTTGDLVNFAKERNLIEINEKHQLYIIASKNGYLHSFIRDIAFTEIASDYSEGNSIVFNQVYNELAKIAANKESK
jgi:hypothetical protein